MIQFGEEEQQPKFQEDPLFPTRQPAMRPLSETNLRVGEPTLVDRDVLRLSRELAR